MRFWVSRCEKRDKRNAAITAKWIQMKVKIHDQQATLTSDTRNCRCIVVWGFPRSYIHICASRHAMSLSLRRRERAASRHNKQTNHSPAILSKKRKKPSYMLSLSQIDKYKQSNKFRYLSNHLISASSHFVSWSPCPTSQNTTENTNIECRHITSHVGGIDDCFHRGRSI